MFANRSAGYADRAVAALLRFAPPVRFSPVGSASLLAGPGGRP
jgi:hypothetical protein